MSILLSAPVDDTGVAGSLVGFGAITRSGLAVDPEAVIDATGAAVATTGAADAPEASYDPETRLEQMIVARIGAAFGPAPAPVVVTVSGAVDPEATFAMLDRAFGPADPAAGREPADGEGGFERLVSERIEIPLAQAALGYIVTAPPPGAREGLVWRMLLYVLTHDYEGRLGRVAIADRGLVYHIGSEYRTDGRRGWVTLSTGVDPGKIDAMEALLRVELARLASDPPSAEETEAARRHLLGRDISAAQSNEEITERLARQYVETGGVRSHDELAVMLADIGPSDLAAAAAAFANGTIMRVDVGAPSGDQP
ncbi:MAG: insulinase family protein [Sphingomonadaceae bacterium]|nr:insulinase family protein [Sphingomonadaceae bacterium]